ncbi:Uncharacterised protein [[Clostridium] sordellii]|uniref:hypothetical protein n=1 Tax=Paraclostridium sordellii TaxID=1505 RepID=UPI0005DE5756|nr:hypothetical protein [Paeniclostridium sordellii]CEQ21556.1 Uncharacterised protein [[Clostridium] sordellii] [Paeniclostridium sordellii]
MKKGLIGILSSIVILGSGFFISNMNTSNKDVHKNEKPKHEKVIKEEKSKKEVKKDDSKKIEKDKDVVEKSIKNNKKDNKSNSKNIEKDENVVEKTTTNSRNINSEEIKTETSKNKKPVETPKAEVKHKVIEIKNIEKDINQSDSKNEVYESEPTKNNLVNENPHNSQENNLNNETNEGIGTEPSNPGPNIGADLD